MGAPQGVLFNRQLTSWRESARIQLGLPDKPLVVVGHQPEFFHPGILAKFIAGSTLSTEVSGALVHLVVDHHIGTSGVVEVPDETGTYLSTKEMVVANVDTNIAMKDQQRTEKQGSSPFCLALQNAEGENLAMQFANATSALMAQYATVGYCIAGTDLLKTDFGKGILREMQQRPEACIAAYNNAIGMFPDCGIAYLAKGELPIWQGKQNSRVSVVSGNSVDCGDLRPRALLLTLLARVVLGDIFVHGTGGFAYDRIMEAWSSNWLGITPCPMVMQTANVCLPLQVETVDEARHAYFSSPEHFLHAIEQAPYGSPERRLQFLAMHAWFRQHGAKPDIALLQRANKVASRRNWAFPLYSPEQLSQLTKTITGCAVPKFS